MSGNIFMPPLSAVGGERHYGFGHTIRLVFIRCTLTPTSISRDAISLYLVEGI